MASKQTQYVTKYNAEHCRRFLLGKELIEICEKYLEEHQEIYGLSELMRMCAVEFFKNKGIEVPENLAVKKSNHGKKKLEIQSLKERIEELESKLAAK